MMQKRRLSKLPSFRVDELSKDVSPNQRWLPKSIQRSREIDLASLHGEKPSLKLMPKYEKFLSVSHLTSFKTAKRIIEDGVLACEKRRCYLPLDNKSCETKGVAFVANTESSVQKLKSASSCGKNMEVKWLIGINGDCGIVNRKSSPYRINDDDINKWRHYILDITNYAKTSVCRILVTKRVYRHLIPYDPTVLGGPWYWDLANDEDYSLQRVLGYNEFIHSTMSCTTNGDIDDAELLLLSWVHSPSEKLIKSVKGIEGLGKPRRQIGVQDVLRELPSIAKKFVPSSESNAIYLHNDAVASLALSLPRESICNEAQVLSRIVFVKACLALLCQCQNMNDFREYLVGIPVALQALFQWLID